MKKKKKFLGIGIFVGIALAVSLLSFFWYHHHYVRPLKSIEIVLPAVVGGEKSLEFELPKGEYITKAIVVGKVLENSKPCKIYYKISVPSQELVIDDEVDIYLGLGFAPTVHLESFKIKKNMTKGTISVKTNTANESGAQIKLRIIESILFRTII